jgi:hypothetical protein
MAGEDMDRAYELWWAGMKKIAPWAVKETVRKLVILG